MTLGDLKKKKLRYRGKLSEISAWAGLTSILSTFFQICSPDAHSISCLQYRIVRSSALQSFELPSVVVPRQDPLRECTLGRIARVNDRAFVVSRVVQIASVVCEDKVEIGVSSSE